MDIVFGGLFTLSAIVIFLFFAVHWKPVLIFLIIMLTVWEPKIGIPMALILSFIAMVWFGRKDLSKALIVESLKFSVYLTAGAILTGLILDLIFGVGSGFSGCSRGSPAGC